ALLIALLGPRRLGRDPAGAAKVEPDLAVLPRPPGPIRETDEQVGEAVVVHVARAPHAPAQVRLDAAAVDHALGLGGGAVGAPEEGVPGPFLDVGWLRERPADHAAVIAVPVDVADAGEPVAEVRAFSGAESRPRGPRFESRRRAEVEVDRGDHAT